MIQPILEPQVPTEQRKIYSVAELSLAIRRQLEQEIGQVWISGEISNFSKPASGHWYFTLKDANAQLRCAVFKNRNRSARFLPEDGQQVLLRAKLSLYEPRGDLQLIGEYIEPAGEGALQIAFNRLKEKLNNKGWFSAEHKKELPNYPEKIGIVTSASGAALHDVLSVLKRRMPQIPVVIYPSQVQGEKAIPSLIAQVELANEQQLCDVLLITRGGGSLEDLWCFNDEKLAETIFLSKLPIISAVGHEVDTSISDLVADLRAPTPSVAAEILVPDQNELRHKSSQLARRFINEFEHKLEVSKARLDKLSAQIIHPKQQLKKSRIELREVTQRLLIANRQVISEKNEIYKDSYYRLKLYDPLQHIRQQLNLLQAATESLTRQFSEYISDKRQALSLTAQKLNDFSPLATLSRGYTITENNKGEIISSIKDIEHSDTLITKFPDGSVQSRVERIHPKNKKSQS